MTQKKDRRLGLVSATLLACILNTACNDESSFEGGSQQEAPAPATQDDTAVITQDANPNANADALANQQSPSPQGEDGDEVADGDQQPGPENDDANDIGNNEENQAIDIDALANADQQQLDENGNPIDPDQLNQGDPNALDNEDIDENVLVVDDNQIDVEPPVAQVISYDDCDGAFNQVSVNADLTQTNVKLDGTVCVNPAPGEVTDATVLFVIDISGSMQANDPIINGTCSRYTATQAIINKVKATLPPNDPLAASKVKMGLVTFDENANVNQVPITLNQFENALPGLTNAICAQNGNTNYEAALLNAKRQLEFSTEASKTVYFISDGLPTRNNANKDLAQIDPNQIDAINQSGVQAALSLRQLDNVVLNAVFLQPVPNIFQQFDPQEAQNYLNQITGNAQQVRLAANADDLADQIVELEVAPNVNIDKANFTLELVLPNGEVQGIGIESLQTSPVPNPLGQIVLDYTSLEFELPVPDNATEFNAQVRIRVQGNGVQDYEKSRPLRIINL